MNSSQDEPTESIEEDVDPVVSSEGNPSESAKVNHHDHVKPQRRRRGKKRKHRKESSTSAACESHQLDSPVWDSDENLSCDTSFANVLIRPINVPKAPENSTQFIMDDHNECRLYMSFDTPLAEFLADPPLVEGEENIIVEPIGEDAAYQDIDYEYESPQDFDNIAYYDREFELSYNNSRYEELLQLPRGELITAFEKLEFQLMELEEELMKHDPGPVLEKLQAELLHLQEENTVLKECNAKLNVLVLKNETDESTTSEHSHENEPSSSKCRDIQCVEGGNNSNEDPLSLFESESHAAEGMHCTSEVVSAEIVTDSPIDDGHDL